MIGLDARLLAVRTLIRSIRSKSYSNLALTNTLMNAEHITPQDSALCRNIFRGTYERLLTLDACIAAHSKRPPEKLDLEVCCVLRCGIYELLYLHTPESAVVNLWTEAVKKLRKTSAAGMVNAVLRGFIRSGKEIPLPQDARAAMSVQYSVPVPLLDALCSDYDTETVRAFLEDAADAPPIYCRRNPLCENSAQKMPLAEPVAGIPYAYIIKKRGETAETPTVIDGQETVPLDPYRSGFFDESKALGNSSMHIQDLASQLCCLALDPQPGETVLDVCAAPGGKSFTIAELMQDQGHVYAYDLHEKRVGLIRQGAEKLKLTCITAQAGDARETEKPQADRILCDVPCSGFGVIRRKPEIRYKSLDELASLPEIQYAILEASAKALKAGGVLVYSTCTVLKRENEDVVRRFLAAHPEYHLEKPWQNLPALASYGQEMTTLFPQMLGSDGFFIARMRKTHI
ncbi:MAG: 16S rRNA (cytosine(967)-C(5))-methyltransferase RsmB [Oscillospiraceae bacterium]|nr:16S rRNA (cytosine(967)-C(5))-methyltransferase RsmB [Oscillospiraceae bacterium]